MSRPYLGRGKQPGAGWLVGGLRCQAVGVSVRQAGPTGSSCSLLGSSCGERETEAVGGRLKAGRADREGTNREGAERETREGAGGAKREKRREEGQLGGRGQASRPPGSFKGSNFLVDG